MLVSPDDVTAILGTVPYDVQPGHITALILKAEVLLKRQLQLRGCSMDVLAADSDMAALLSSTVVDAVVRVLRNPEGLKSESEGDYSYSLDPTAASGNVWFPDRDLALICPASSGVGSIQLGLPAWRRFG